MIKKFYLTSFVILSLFYYTACHRYDVDEFLNFDENKIISLQVESPVLPADGASTTLLIATLPSNASSTNRNVTFTTTAGSFYGSKDSKTVQVAIDVNGIAQTFLQSPRNIDLPYTIVTAKVGDYLKTETIQFIRAFPEKIIVDSTSIVLKANLSDHIDLTAKLIRNVGVPTPGTVVEFSASESNGNSIGSFYSIQPSDNEGEAMSKFTVGYTPYRGEVKIFVSVNSVTNIVVGSIQITIID
jgi:hypothetical protein